MSINYLTQEPPKWATVTMPTHITARRRKAEAAIIHAAHGNHAKCGSNSGTIATEGITCPACNSYLDRGR